MPGEVAFKFKWIQCSFSWKSPEGRKHSISLRRWTWDRII